MIISHVHASWRLGIVAIATKFILYAHAELPDIAISKLVLSVLSIYIPGSYIRDGMG